MAAKIYGKIKYELFMLVAFAAAVFFSRAVPGEIVPVSITYYLADYSIGFCSRMLIASFVNLINKHPTAEWLTYFSWAVLLAVAILVFFLMGKVIRRLDENTKKIAVALSVFAVTGPYALINFSTFLGYLDIYWFLFAVLSVLAAGNRYLRWLIPIFSFGGVAVNYGYLITYFPVVVCVLLYFIIKEKNKGCIALTAITCISALAATVYFVMFADKTLVLSLEEFHEYIRQKYSGPLDLSYIDFYLYSVTPDDGEYSSYVDQLSGIAELVSNKADDWMLYLRMLIIFIPIVVVSTWLWIKTAKKSEKKSEKFLYAVFALSQLAVVPASVVSTDVGRWFQSTVIIQIMLMFFMLYKGDEEFKIASKEMYAFFRRKPILTLSAFVLYSATFFGNVSSF